jgi:Ca2+-binding EF-hand superfamily protein
MKLKIGNFFLFITIALNQIDLTLSFSVDINNRYKGFIKDHPNGNLSIKELKKIYADLFPEGDCEKFSQYAFRKFDTNCDGKIDFRFVIRSHDKSIIY